MSAGQGARRARGTIVAVALLLGAGALFFAQRERGSEPAAVPGAPAAAAIPAPQSAATLAADAPLFPVTGSALDELASSVDLRPTVSSENCGTANGRAAAMATLQQAEDSTQHVYELIAESVTQARAAADNASLDAAGREALHEDVRNATDRTLMLSGRLRDARHQAITTARRLITFMDDNAGGFEVQDGAVRFSNQSAQVQFSHFQSNTTRVLGEELLVRKETVDALAEQDQLLARAQTH